MTRPSLEESLVEAQALGFLGPGAIEPQVEHALAFGPLLGAARLVLDLGSGGGLPGLVLAVADRSRAWVLLDANRRRARFLAATVVRLGLGDTVTVACGRAEELGRDPQHRERYDAVVSRSFGSPAVTAECASPFVRVGGVVIVSEPPDGSEDRWPPTSLATLGLEPAGSLDAPSLVRFRKTAPTPSSFPRRVGVPAKRPLWTGST